MTHTRSTVTLLAVALVALAGCGGLAGDAGDAETLTPAPVPTEAEPVVPGVWADHVEADTVVSNHVAALGNRSFTLERTLRIGPPEAPVFEEHVVTQVGANDSQLLMERSIPTATAGYRVNASSIWWDGDTARYRYQFSSGQESVIRIATRPATPRTLEDRLSQLLGSFAPSSVTETSEGVVVAGRITDPSAVPQIDRLSAVRNATMTIRIAPDGHVDRLAVGYDASVNGTRYSVRYTAAFSAIGETDPAAPAWVSSIVLG